MILFATGDLLQPELIKIKSEATHKVTEVQVDKWYIVTVNQNQGDYPVKEKTIVNDSLDNLSL